MNDWANTRFTAITWSGDSPRRTAGSSVPWPAETAMAACCVAGKPSVARAGANVLLSFVVRIVPSSAIPNTPPTSREVLVIADPSPARCGPTEFITAAVIGAMVAPIPWPMMMNTGISSTKDVSAFSQSPRASRPPPARSRP